MPTDSFHDRPFDEGTLTKLNLFELYVREWLPVFLSRPNPIYKTIRLFDFFAGPGTDSKDVPGSPIRLLQEINTYRRLQGWGQVKVQVHLFDSDPEKIETLKDNIARLILDMTGIELQCEAKPFAEAFAESLPILKDRHSAKLLFIDQFGVSHVADDVFRSLAEAPVCDFLFFLSSSTLHRFHDHPAIPQKIDRPDDYYHVHRKAREYYQSLLPPNHPAFLAAFSIKKGSNIYGLIFGSRHPLGISKFLEVAWKTDQINGEADFDIDRENMIPGQNKLFDDIRPSKITNFERDLERRIRDGHVKNESDVIRVCFEHGVLPAHAALLLSRLTNEGVIACDFKSPNIKNMRKPRPIRLVKGK